MSIKSVELRKQAAEIHAQAVALMSSEGRTKEQDSKIDTILADVDKTLAEAERHERSEKADAALRATVKPPENAILPEDTKCESADPKERDGKERDAFRIYMLNGENAMTQEQRSLLRKAPVEQRAGQNVATNTAGGYLIPQGFQSELETAMVAYGNMLADCRVLDTPSGNTMFWPTSNDTGNEATLIGEAIAATEKDLTVGHVSLGAYKYTSGLVLVSAELEQDSFTSVDSLIRDAFAVRFGRGLNRAFTTGSGSSAPTGILTAIAATNATPVVAVGDNANTGISGNTGVNSIGYFDLVNLLHSVDPAYRDAPKARFMFHDQVLQQLRKILDKYGRPIWNAGLTAGAPSTILDKSYSINQQMPLSGDTSPASGLAVDDDNPVIVFGDFSKFVIRRVKEMSVVRLIERYAEYNQIGLLGFARYDSKLIDAGQASGHTPLNYLVMAT